MKDTNNKQRKIVSVFYEEYRKKVLTEFDFETVVNGAMVETIDGKKVKIDKIDKEHRRIYGFTYDEDRTEWNEMRRWWDENGCYFGFKDFDNFSSRENLAILNYAPLIKNDVKKDKCKKIIKPFNLDAVLNGALVETRDGREVEIGQIMNHPSYGRRYCIWAYIIYNGRKQNGNCYWWASNGRFLKQIDEEHGADLVIVEYVEDNSKTDDSELKNIDINYGGTKITIQIEKNNDCIQEKIIKPFNLDAARNGAQIETKRGNRVIVHHIEDKPSRIGKILCAYEECCTGRCLNWWCSDGRRFENEDSDSDLVIVEYVPKHKGILTVKPIDIDGLKININIEK